jgi:hypothetical protein
MIDGFNKHSPSLSNLLINGTVQPMGTITGTLQSRIDATNKTRSTKATWEMAVESEHSIRGATTTFVVSVKQAILVAFAGQNDVLADFGLKSRPKRVLTTEQLAARAAKAKATREARHTMGPKQKAAIKGTVTPTAPATTAPPAATPSPATPPVAPATPAVNVRTS